VTAFFASTFYIEKSSHIQNIEKRYTQTALFLHKHFRQSMHNNHSVDFSEDTVRLYLKESAFKRVDDTKVFNILKHAKVMKKRKVLRSHMQILRIKKKLYLSLKNHRYHILLRDKEQQSPPYRLLLGYFGSLLFLLGLYFWLTRSLLPIKTLQNKIAEVAKGDLTVSFKSKKHDEIAQVSNAFDSALRKLESLIDSRQLFLRAIMHELKTPIGKGKLLNSFVKEEKVKEGYEDVFNRLELLLTEFAKIEQMLSANYEVKLGVYNAKDLVEQALELMIMDESALEKQVSIKVESPLQLSTDFSLFPLALKNLIDNAINYAPDQKVEIIINDLGISIRNNGSQFTNSIENYFKPFHGKGKGLGLGLYIVHNIMDMLKLELNYSYVESQNRFLIVKPII
jgi:two-component system OmpR family sensor kinase